jgi:hypothetical protein
MWEWRAEAHLQTAGKIFLVGIQMKQSPISRREFPFGWQIQFKEEQSLIRARLSTHSREHEAPRLQNASCNLARSFHVVKEFPPFQTINPILPIPFNCLPLRYRRPANTFCLPCRTSSHF